MKDSYLTVLAALGLEISEERVFVFLNHYAPGCVLFYRDIWLILDFQFTLIVDISTLVILFIFDEFV